MLVLHFAFGDPARNPYAPHNHTPVNVIYTGTHDNNTSLGWFEEDASSAEIANLSRYLGREVNRRTAAGEMVRMAMSSVECLGYRPQAQVTLLSGRVSCSDGNWSVTLFTGTSKIKPDGSADGPLYAAWLPCYRRGDGERRLPPSAAWGRV